MASRTRLTHGRHTYTLRLERAGAECVLRGELDGKEFPTVTALTQSRDPFLTITIGNKPYRCAAVRDGDGVWVGLEGRVWHLKTSAVPASAGTATHEATSEIRAPMTGTVIKVNVEPGAAVKSGDLLAVMEAMKMEYRLEAQGPGTVERVLCRPGDLLNVGALLIQMAPLPSA
jgi:acetyl/propionyl-CoA carboxylase alpha subunit